MSDYPKILSLGLEVVEQTRLRDLRRNYSVSADDLEKVLSDGVEVAGRVYNKSESDWAQTSCPDDTHKAMLLGVQKIETTCPKCGRVK